MQPSRVNAITSFVLVSTFFLYHARQGGQSLHYHDPPALRGSLARRLVVLESDFLRKLRANARLYCVSQGVYYFNGRCYQTIGDLCQDNVCLMDTYGNVIRVMPHRNQVSDEEIQSLQSLLMAYILGMRLSFFGCLIVQGIFAYFYWSKVVALIPRVPQQPQLGTTEFKQGLFDCGDFHLCLHSWFCPLCRLAHTLHVTQIQEYWTAIVAMVVAAWCAGVCCGPLVLWTYWRMELKRKLGIEPDCCADCCLSLFCQPCTVQQGSAAVDELSGVQVRCCCTSVRQARNLDGTDGVQMVTMQASSQQPFLVSQPVAGMPVQPSIVCPPNTQLVQGVAMQQASMAQPLYGMPASGQPVQVVAYQQPPMTVNPSGMLAQTTHPAQVVAVQHVPMDQLSNTMTGSVQPPQAVAVQQPSTAQPSAIMTNTTQPDRIDMMSVLATTQPDQAVASLETPPAHTSTSMTESGQPVQAPQPPIDGRWHKDAGVAGVAGNDISWQMIDGRWQMQTADEQSAEMASAQPTTVNAAGAAQQVVPSVTQALGQNNI